MENDEKVCPRCAETVKAGAIICKHCNYQFGTPVQPVSPSVAAALPPKKKKRPFMIGCLSIVGIVVVLAFIGSQMSPSNNSSSGGAPNASTPEIAATAVTSVQLAAAYHANEVAAQSTYGDKALDVTGTVTGVTLDFMDNPTLQMEGVNEFLPVQAKFDKSYGSKLAAISKGMQVTVRCTSITEVISAPMLDDCTIP